MKKYFSFDDEPITGSTYWQRMLFGYITSFMLIGLWIASATAYKRAGAFGWKKEIRIISAILIPLWVISSVYNKLESKSSSHEELHLNLLDVIGLISYVFHIVLIWSDGNRDLKGAILQEFEITDRLNLGFDKIILKTKYFRGNLYFQIRGKSDQTFAGFSNHLKLPIEIILINKSEDKIHNQLLPNKIFNSKKNSYLKDGIWKFESKIEIEENLANQITSVQISTANND
jgi:hypothetical protein